MCLDFQDCSRFSEICYINHTEIITHMPHTLIQCALVTEERFLESIRNFRQRKGRGLPH